ncbi:MAG: OPT/YSL family transporter, partial [Caldimonas sp.]
MNFSLGFFVGGQVLAGLLGSTVTLGYGAEGKHGANYIQTAAASVAGMSAMGVLIQAMVWMGLPQPPTWQLVLYLLAIGMFGAGVGMLYTPVLVDRMQLTFPSGLAVANILRALTDPVLLRRSVGLLGSGVATGLGGGIAAAKVGVFAAIDLSTSTFGAGMVVGARIGLAALTGGLLGLAFVPWFISVGWLAPGEPFRKITFLIALGTIMGAAIV